MATNTLNILAEREQPDRSNLRSGGRLDFEEQDVWGKKPEYLGKYPAQLTPMLEEEASRARSGELRDHGLPLQQARPRAVLSVGPRASARWSTTRCSI